MKVYALSVRRGISTRRLLAEARARGGRIAARMEGLRPDISGVEREVRGEKLRDGRSYVCSRYTQGLEQRLAGRRLSLLYACRRGLGLGL